MAVFNRKAKNQSGVSKELEEYYQNERRERFGVAWLLAFGTLVTTLLLASALFFGGRWLYRAVTDTDENGDVTTTDVGQQIPGLSIDESPSQPKPGESLPSSALQPVPPPTPRPTPSPSSATDLPRTGPESDL
ncbi:MAG: hypothetical protein AAB459_01060 [Patescibacteria group bacterium]